MIGETGIGKNDESANRKSAKLESAKREDTDLVRVKLGPLDAFR